MAIKTSEEILNYIKEKVGDDTSDETLNFIEDVSDTFNDLEKKSKEETDWKKKYEDNDKEWRQKYRDRFFSGNEGGETNTDPIEPPKAEGTDDTSPKTFDDLFTHKKG